jgi:hypothetical protein
MSLYFKIINCVPSHIYYLRLHRKYVFREKKDFFIHWFFKNLNLNFSLQKDKQKTILAKVISEVTRV